MGKNIDKLSTSLQFLLGHLVYSFRLYDTCNTCNTDVDYKHHNSDQ